MNSFYGILFNIYENAIELSTMHKTNAGEKIKKTLQKRALNLARDAKAMMKVASALSKASHKAKKLQEGAEKARAGSYRLGWKLSISSKWSRSRSQRRDLKINLLDGYMARRQKAP
jgi:hypothetical protein